MTIEEKLNSMLVENGMFDSQAAAVIERVKADEANEPMASRWKDDISDYPPQLLAVLWLTVRRIALAYIEETCPLVWFKPMFEV